MRSPLASCSLLCRCSPTDASAHIVKGEAIGFVSGFEHPISGLDHIIAMVAVGLWGAQLGAPAIWLLPVTFPLVMAFGGFLGLIGVPLPGSEIAIALVRRVPRRRRAHRSPSAALGRGPSRRHLRTLPRLRAWPELPPGQNALLYSIGFILATGLLHATGITIGLVHRWPWGQCALRGAGAVVLCGGLIFLWGAVA